MAWEEVGKSHQQQSGGALISIGEEENVEQKCPSMSLPVPSWPLVGPCFRMQDIGPCL